MQNSPSSAQDISQDPRSFYCSWSAAAFMVLLILVIIGSSLTFVVSQQTGLYTDNPVLIKTATGLLVLLFLRITENRWFALTCQRFASIDNGELVIYGALGRKRWRGKTEGMRFYYGTDSEGAKRRLLLEHPDGRIHSFSLRLCQDPDALADALGAINRLDYEIEQAKQFCEKHIAHLKTYTKMFLFPVALIAFIQILILFFWSIQLQPAAWHAGTMLGVMAALPLCVWSVRPLRHFRWFNLPAHHYWRRHPLGHAAAEALYYLKFASLMLLICSLYRLFFAYNVGMISLLEQTQHTVLAEVSTSNGECSRNTKYSQASYWKLHVKLLDPYTQFNGDWCSFQSTQSAPPAEGSYTVHVRESQFVRELIFDFDK